MMELIPARLVGVAIETPAEQLRQEAMRAQADWFKSPASEAARERYANALARWARDTGNKKALYFSAQVLDWAKRKI